MISLPSRCVFYRPDHNAKGDLIKTEFWRSWNTEIKYINGQSSKKVDEKKGVISLAIKNGSFSVFVVVVVVVDDSK